MSRPPPASPAPRGPNPAAYKACAYANLQRSNCVICGKGQFDGAIQIASIASNVRRWSKHRSTVWRCSFCGCLHSLEVQDLGQFYDGYPYGRRRLDGFTRKVFAHYVARLRRHGLKPTHAVLDYGCSEGLLLEYLREIGFTDCAGYDSFSANYSDPGVLKRRYDAVICQDVIEHVEDPRQLLDSLSRILNPGGLLCVGTPRADGIDLARPEASIHSLHQPFHLHVLAQAALTAIAADAGLFTERVYVRHSCDTPYPFVNWPFLSGYLKAIDNTLDAGFDPPRIGFVATSPRLLFLGLLGYLLPKQNEMIGIFRKKGAK